jgi:hypothetical protein
MRDVVVLLPGITGSVLQKDGKDLWAISGQAAWSILTSLGSSLQQLKLAGDDPEVDDLGDGIIATRLMPDAHLVPGLWKIYGYSALSHLINDYFQVTWGSLSHEPILPRSCKQQWNAIQRLWVKQAPILKMKQL